MFTVTGSARRPTVYHRWLMVLTKPGFSGKSRFWTPHILRRALDTSLGVKNRFFSDFMIFGKYYKILFLILVGTRSPDPTPKGSGPGLRARPPPGPPGPGPGRVRVGVREGLREGSRGHVRGHGRGGSARGPKTAKTRKSSLSKAF